MLFLNHLITFLYVVLLVSILGCFATFKKEKINNQGMTGTYIDDNAITVKVKVAISEEPSLQSEAIGVETVQGTMQLKGFVSSIIVMEKAIEIARGINGVRAIKDEMRLRWQH